MIKPQATTLEVLLAIAMSGYYQTTHVHYMPIGKQYTKTLMRLRGESYVVPMGENFYTLTKKGRDYITRQNITECSKVDSKIDEFIDNL